MKLDYDRSADVLYVTFSNGTGKCEYLENSRGHIIKIDSATSEIVGCTIPMFSRRVAEGELEIPEIGPVRLAAALAELRSS